MLKLAAVGEAPGDNPIDFADFDEPNRAAAAAGPAAEKLETGDAGSSVFFLPPKSEPRKPSFSFLPFLSLSFFEKNPPFFSFSFSFSFSRVLDVEVVDAEESFLVNGAEAGIGGGGVYSLTGCGCSFGGKRCSADGNLVTGGAIPGGSSY